MSPIRTDAPIAKRSRGDITEELNKILIVDGEHLNINVLADLLRLNYQIMAATNGQQAL